MFPFGGQYGYGHFMGQCSKGDGEYSLTPASDLSPYASCFVLFGRKLIQEFIDLNEVCAIDALLRSSIHKIRGCGIVLKDKPFRQLLAFCLSALATIKQLDGDPLQEIVTEQLPQDVGLELRALGCLSGRPGSGNQAMFMAIFLLHARDYLRIATGSRIDEWVDLHLRHINRFGFWGDDRHMTHLQFQNGYHQHEILEYLGIENPRKEAMLEAVRSLADEEGRFAPYPGGGGCYDYDAVFLLTPNGRIPDEPTRKLLLRTAESIIASQNEDGGFCESQYVRPRSLSNLMRFARHIYAVRSNPAALLERLRYGLTLQRPKHDRIHTHWSRYSRRWNESDLWDSWFRMLALARIEVALDPSKAADWGFIDYPGIGYHPSLRAKSVNP